MSAMINTVRASARRFVDDGWLPLVLFTWAKIEVSAPLRAPHPLKAGS
jgi:hypothetical protein